MNDLSKYQDWLPTSPIFRYLLVGVAVNSLWQCSFPASALPPRRTGRQRTLPLFWQKTLLDRIARSENKFDITFPVESNRLAEINPFKR